MLPKFGKSLKFGRFQKIAQKFCAILKMAENTPKNLPHATKLSQKLPKIAHNSYIFFNKTQKAPKFWRNFNLGTALRPTLVMTIVEPYSGGDNSEALLL